MSAEDLREQLRHAEERVSQLRADNANLEQRLLRSTALRIRTAGYVMAAAGAGMLGFALANRPVDSRSLDPGASFIAHENTLGVGEDMAQCQASSEVTKSKLASCQRELAQPPTPPSGAPRPPGRCRCEPFDPLCSCL